MDPELTKGFQELQAQVIESRAKISNIETCQKLTTYDAKINDSILEGFSKDGDIENKFFYQPVGRMYVRQEGRAAQDFLLERKKQYQVKLKQYEEVRGVCLSRVKESENSLRELVNKKRNESEQATNNQQQAKQATSVTSAQSSENKSLKEKDSTANK